jgi:quercetin dioxygenase-like cupin family protein
MSDGTIKKISERSAPKGTMGQTYLVLGKSLAMRLWDKEPPQENHVARRDYETVGYVIAGRAELILEGQSIKLEVGDSWLVPAQAEHSYRILETFTAVEATAPPAQIHARDEAKS